MRDLPRWVLCVGAVVLRGDQVLWVRQAKGHSLEGQWSIPWGFADPGEAPEAAAVRETLEEAGVEARATGLLGTQNLRSESWIALVYLCQHLQALRHLMAGKRTQQATSRCKSWRHLASRLRSGVSGS